ncbi:unnamed protein product, partial [Ectocarpus sp. 8 AP-2014]
LQSGKTKGTIAKSMSNIYRQEGWLAFWNGNGANTLKIMPESAIRFLGYEIFKNRICKDPDNVRVGERFLAGSMAGSLAQLVIYPLEIAKTRLAVGEKGEFKGIGDCLTRIVRENGLRGLFRGLPASLMGIVPYSGTDLAMFY